MFSKLTHISRGLDNAALPNLIFSANFDKQKTNNRADVFLMALFIVWYSQVNRKCQKKVESTPSFLTLFDPSSRKCHLLFDTTGCGVFSTKRVEIPTFKLDKLGFRSNCQLMAGKSGYVWHASLVAWIFWLVNWKAAQNVTWPCFARNVKQAIKILIGRQSKLKTYMYLLLSHSQETVDNIA